MSSKYSFAIDRGGTFTDIFCRHPDGRIETVKLLSEDPASYEDAPREGIRRLVQEQSGILIDPTKIEWIRMGTTVATNALLERKGQSLALAVTNGFRDVLSIGNQSRPNIFDLKVKCPEVLYSDVVEIDERVVLSHPKCQMTHKVRKITSITGEQVEIWKELDEDKTRRDLTNLLKTGIDALAVVLINSYTYPDHERRVGQIAQEVGFRLVTLSHEVMPMIKVVPRGLTTTADAYLTPKIRSYIDGFTKGFDTQKQPVNVLFLKSDGGLTSPTGFCGSQAILSGPAGGVVGYSLTCQQELGNGTPVIGFDMGGTSTDVSRFDGQSFQHTFESIISGIAIQAPQLDIKTVAAGGGSRLFFRSGLFVVGPESAGANPGPVCYRHNGPLAVTDANLLLGRIIPDFFPHIFGPNQNEPLDVEATRSAFEVLTKEVNENLPSDRRKMTQEEVALGYIRVANEAMCRPIRSITEGKGHDSSEHVLSCFGGAGGQHACSVAKSLGIKKVFVHRFSGILSAYGMALADVVEERQEPSSFSLNSKTFPDIIKKLKCLQEECSRRLIKQGFSTKQISSVLYLNLRYEKTDFALMTPSQQVRYEDDLTSLTSDFYKNSFEERYQQEFGFNFAGREIIVDDIRVRSTAKSDVGMEFEIKSTTPNTEPFPERTTKCIFETDALEAIQLDTKIFVLDNLLAGHLINGPTIIVDRNSTILVEPECQAVITKKGNIVISISNKEESKQKSLTLDPITLSIFSHRFMSIAEQMGTVLQRTSTSTNIKERLDFSCALFGPDGGLVSNAPHIPVHLGSMQRAVQFQLEYREGDIHEGDVILSNHPMAGGSHLPDLTVITPVFDVSSRKPVFFVASRGHHADIGGSRPGSMPPDSQKLEEEGATFISLKIVEKGIFQEERVVEELMKPQEYPGCSGCRCLSDVLSDLRAQVAANNRGIHLVQQLIGKYGLTFVQAYMKYIQENAEIAVRDMLKTISFGKEVVLHASDFMDDGTEIVLNVKINGETGDAIFDFTGTGIEVNGNLNAPEAVTFSAIIYCLRCMIGHDVPLNQGCLAPIKVILPKGSLLSPSVQAAVVGGNVETSQRVVDVIFKAFVACGASQGCMNNVTFGDESFGYYETIAGGAGAGPTWSGTHAVHTHMTNTRITDPEILEKRYPVIVKSFYVNKGSGGQGKYPGGDGVIRELLFRKDIVLSILTERRAFAPYGLLGGKDGRRGKNIVTFMKDGRRVNVGSKSSLNVGSGDVLRIETPGGGGYGQKSSEN